MGKNHQDDLLQTFSQIVGKKYLLTKDVETRQYRKGYRFGEGSVFAVVRPGTLLEQWQVLNEAIRANCIVIMQAANTGLTGGSTPVGDDYDRQVIIISTNRIKAIQLLDDGKQVVCLPGSSLNDLEQKLLPLGREPHSVLGSSCVGASIIGGVCNNSGGALVRRGPSYTELALFAQINERGEVELVNHLGIELGDDPETILKRLESSDYRDADVDAMQEKEATNSTYQALVKAVDEPTPARFNNDPRNLFEASGSAGKLAVFAVRLDTFKIEESEVFYVATNDPDDLTDVRRHLLTQLPSLPISGEYIDRNAFTQGKKYGKDTFFVIEKLGTNKIPQLFSFKNKVDGFFEKLGIKNISDRILQLFSYLLPRHLPKFMLKFEEQFEHHLIIEVAQDSVAETRQFLSRYFKESSTGTFHHCSKKEGEKAFLHRFVIAGASARYKNTHPKIAGSMISLDVALRRNDREWVEELPAEIEEKILEKLYYGHFFCHVFHQIYVLKKGVDPLALEHEMWKILDKREAEYPAEHNVGHLYFAKAPLANFYQRLDPTNTMNPGIGLTPKKRDWQKSESDGQSNIFG